MESTDARVGAAAAAAGEVMPFDAFRVCTADDAAARTALVEVSISGLVLFFQVVLR